MNPPDLSPEVKQRIFLKVIKRINAINMNKSLLQSKTFWFNIVMFLVDVSVYLQSATPSKYLPLLSAIQAVGNIALRIFFTGGQITKVI